MPDMTVLELASNPGSIPEKVARIPKSTETSQESDEYLGQRQKLRELMERKGNILPDSHPFTQIVRTVSEKEKVPGNTDFVVIDSDEVEAFFHPDSRTVPRKNLC